MFRDQSGKLEFQLPEPLSKKLELYEGKEVTLGIRPEDIYDASQKRVASGVKGKLNLEVVEPMGNEIFLYLNLPSAAENGQFVARIDARQVPQVGTEFEFEMNTEKVHFFDKQTDKALI